MPNLFRVVSLLVFSILVHACAQTGPQREAAKVSSSSQISDGNSSASPCGYSDIAGSEYRLTATFAPYASNMFFFDAERSGGMAQLNSAAYETLSRQPFKVVATGLLTADAKVARQPYLAQYRYSEIILGGDLFKIDKGNSTKVLTEDCSVYYFKVGQTPKFLEESIVQNNGQPLTTEQFINLTGPTALVPVNTNAKIEIDRFTGEYKVTTPYFDSMLLRGTVNGTTGELNFAQLYSDLVFFGDWGSIRSAIDTQAKLYEVTKIDTEADCSSSRLTGCRLTETIGVTLGEDFLEQNREGFELRFQGSKTREITIPGSLVRSFLEGIQTARSSSIQ
ncbi:hypothetical protein N9850_11070 [Granulosicoccus sp.]|nr:hypothetical protein [Granulosicoccus sp.]MDB4224305.1 hypothetical protein [Granulosicoccus sp.]